MKKIITDKHQKICSKRTPKKLKLAPIAKAVSLSIFSLGMINGLSYAATIEVDTNLDANNGCTLRKAIDSMVQQSAISGCTVGGDFGDNDEITFSSAIGNLINLTQGALTISPTNGVNPFAIDASDISGGMTIDANNASRVFYIMGGYLGLKNLNISGGSVGNSFAHGGGIYISNSNVSLSGCTVSGNSAAIGGGISVSDSSTLVVESSTISSNSVFFRGGGIGEKGGFGPSESPNQITIIDSVISNNFAYNEGAGLQFQGQVEIIDSVIAFNSTYFDIYSSTFNSGGGIFLEEAANVTIRNSEIRANKAYDGGGISIARNALLTLERTTVENNRAFGDGGGIKSWSGEVNIINSSVSDNQVGGIARGAGGGISLISSTAVITSSEITGNTAGQSGGGIRIINGSSLIVTSSDISNNSVVQSSGGGLHIGGGTASINNSTITDNFAYQGGGINFAYYGSLTVSNSSINSNYATLGAGIKLQGNITNIAFSVNRSTISNNVSSVGGGIHSILANSTIEETTISNNSADAFGAGVALDDNSRFNFSYGTVSRNTTANGRGGAFWIRDSSRATISNSTLFSNSAVYGGGIITYQGGVATLTNTTVSGNSAALGGGFLPFNTGRVILNSSTVSNNRASQSGGGFFAASEGTVSLKNSIVADSPTGEDCNSYNANISSDTASIIESGGCVTSARRVDPKLMPLADNGGPTRTHALSIGSPASNKGILASCPAVDQRGEKRGIDDGFCDVGAFELNFAEGAGGLGYLPAILKTLLFD